VFVLLLLSVLPSCAQGRDQRGGPSVSRQDDGQTGAPPAPGEVLFDDTFDDPDAGLLPKLSPSPAYVLGYEGGEYFVRKVDPEFTRLPLGVIPGSYADTTLAVDARVVGDTTGRYVALECRRSPMGWYRAYVDPDGGRFWLARWDEGSETLLTARTSSAAIARGNDTNHLELTCAGSLITPSVNGTEVANVVDSTYEEGGMAIGASVFTASRNTVDARFDNLVVYQAAAPSPAEP